MHDPSLRNPAYKPLTDQQLAELDEQCDRFDEELVRGRRPRIETFLANAPEAARNGLLAELLAIELEYLTQRGGLPDRSGYARRFPEQEGIVAEVFRSAEVIRSSGPGGDVTLNDGPPELGNFRLIQEIGRGGMGVVWLAEQDEPVKRRVALKLIKSELTSRDAAGRFEAEKRALAMMDHPNIARVLDAGTTANDRPYFVMELVEGVPITQFCDENRLSVDERLQLFVPICKAVQHAHHKGIIHRDLKPSNVLVTAIDGQAVPKVIDFGLAKAVEQHLRLTDVTMQTEFGKVVGTLQYMSPEQTELKGGDAEDVDTRTDVYSLGVMLYELLTGSTPLDKTLLGRSALLKVLEIIREKEPPRPSNRLSSSSHEANSIVGDLRRLHPSRLQQLLRGELDCVVMKALEKDRTRRYQTANDLAQDVTNYLSGDAVTARPPSTWYQVQKFAGRNRGLVTALFTIGTVLLAGIVGTGYGLMRANQKTTEAEKERGKAKASENRALLAKDKAQMNERRAVDAESRATEESLRARDAEASATFQLAVARYNADRAVQARSLLHQIPPEYRDNFEWHCCRRSFQGSDRTCYGHLGDVYEVAFAADGSRVVSAGHGGTIRLWDAVTGQQLSRLDGHQGQIQGLAVSPDGTRIASAGQDRIIRIWDVESGELIRTLNGHAGPVGSVAFDSAGKRLASASDDKTIKLWDTETGAEIKTLTGHLAAVTGIAFSPDDRRLASSSERDRTVRIWDADSGKEITVVRRGRPDTRRPAFSPDGTRLATISYGMFVVWDTTTWKPLIEGREAHDRMVRCVTFSPDGTRFATCADDATIKLWETRSGRLIATLSGHARNVWSIAFSPDGSRLVSGSRDNTVRIWNTIGDNALTLRGHPGEAFCVAYSPSGRLLASGGSKGVIILRDALTSEVRFRLTKHQDDVNDLSFSPDGTRLASAADDGTVRLWDTQTGQELAVLRGHSGAVRGVAFRPAGTGLASGSTDGTIRLWNAQTYQETAAIHGHGSVVYCVAFSPDGSRLASGSRDTTVKLWDAGTGEEIRTLAGHNGLVRAIAFGPRGERIASAGYDTKVRVWNIASGKPIATATVHSGAVFGLAFSPDGKRIAAGGTDRAVSLFDASSGDEIIRLPSGGAGISAVNFSHDRSQLAAATNYGELRVWAASQNSHTGILIGHPDTVTAVSFSEDASRIYSESEKEKLVWNVATRQTIQEAEWERPTTTTQASPDGRWLVTTELNHVVLVDLEQQNLPGENTRGARMSFDPVRHQVRARKAAEARDWYAAVFHNAWLLRHDPDSMKYYTALQSSYRRLVTSDETALDELSRLTDATGKRQATFYESYRKQIVPVVPTDRIRSSGAEPSPESEDRSNGDREPPLTDVADSNLALYFNGASYADLGDIPFYGKNFTIEGWIRPDANERSGSISVFTLRSGETETAVAAEVGADGRLRVIHRNPPGGAGGVDIRSGTKINDGQWHHFAIVKGEDDRLHLYIDGAPEASADTVAEFGNAAFRVVLGTNVKTSPRYFEGLMDEVRFWNTAETREQIISRLQSSVDSESPGLVACFDFDQRTTASKIEAAAGVRPTFAPTVLKTLEAIR